MNRRRATIAVEIAAAAKAGSRNGSSAMARSPDAAGIVLPPSTPAIGDGEPDPARLPWRTFVPFLAGATILALAYGASFMLPDALRSASLPPASAGRMIGAGTVASLVGAAVAGRVAQRVGLMLPIVGAGVVVGLALACFAMLDALGAGIGYVGGVLLGLGWAVAYILMPVQLITCLGSAPRLEALLLLSGSQMIGIGLSAPIGRLLAAWAGGIGRAFAIEALLCAVAAGLLVVAGRRFLTVQAPQTQSLALDWRSVRAVLRGRTALPVVMIGLAACSFSGLSTFQSLLAAAHGVPPEAFFLTFTATTVTLRFCAASRIGRLRLPRLAVALALAMLAGLTGLAASGGHLGMWVAATLVFSIGYGLNYSTLNALIVGLAERDGLPVPVASQVFTLGYFVGLFGFPLVAERTIALAGIDAVITVLAGIALADVGVALVTLRQGRDRP